MRNFVFSCLHPHRSRCQRPVEAISCILSSALSVHVVGTIILLSAYLPPEKTQNAVSSASSGEQESTEIEDSLQEPDSATQHTPSSFRCVTDRARQPRFDNEALVMTALRSILWATLSSGQAVALCTGLPNIRNMDGDSLFFNTSCGNQRHTP